MHRDAVAVAGHLLPAVVSLRRLDRRSAWQTCRRTDGSEVSGTFDLLVFHPPDVWKIISTLTLHRRRRLRPRGQHGPLATALEDGQAVSFFVPDWVRLPLGRDHEPVEGCSRPSSTSATTSRSGSRASSGSTSAWRTCRELGAQPADDSCSKRSRSPMSCFQPRGRTRRSRSVQQPDDRQHRRGAGLYRRSQGSA